jgi:hypothetical protein
MDFKLTEGIRTYYYPDNGKRMANGRTTNGMKVGIWIYFDKNGKVLSSRKETPETYYSSPEPVPGTPLYYFLSDSSKYLESDED